MDQLLPIQKENASALTMSSREIAEVISNRHSVVCRSIERLIEKGVIKGYAPAVYTHEQNGQQYYEYHLEKRDTYVVVAQLSPEFTARLVDRWQELENQQNQVAKIPQTYSEALRLAADLADQNQALQIENNQKSEHIESLESYFRGGISPFEFAKGLNGVNSLKVGEFLVGKNWMFQEGNRKRVKSYARDLYLTEQVDEIAKHGKEPFIAYKPVLLKKGAAKLYDWYVKGLLPMKSNWNGEFTQDKAVGL